MASNRLGFMARFFRRRARGTDIDQFKLAVVSFNDSLSRAYENEKLIRAWKMLVFNEDASQSPSILAKNKKRGFAEVHGRKANALYLLFRLYNLMSSGPERFNQQKNEIILNIKRLHPRLAKKAALIQMPVAESKVIVQLRKASANEQILVSYIQTHYPELLNYLESLKGTKFAEIAAELRRAIIILSGIEKAELIKCMDDIHNWRFKLAFKIDFFMERIGLFINGGQSKIDGETFGGFNLRFKDKKLVARMLADPEARKLIFYKNEVELFTRARYAINKSLETKSNWEGFYEFYDNLDKGRNYIKTVRETFGNEQFARLLEAFKEKKHEAPVDWEHELDMLTKILITRAYQFVIEPAGNSLLRIFYETLKGLDVERETAFRKMRDLLAKLDLGGTAKRKLLKLIAKTRKKIIAELNYEQLKFKLSVAETLGRLPELVDLFNEVLQNGNFDPEFIQQSRIGQPMVAWYGRALEGASILKIEDELKTFKDDNAARYLYGRLEASLYQTERLAEMQRMVKMKVDSKIQNSFAAINALTVIIKNEILPNTGRHSDYIKSKLEKDYLPSANSLIQEANTDNGSAESRAKVVNMDEWRNKKIRYPQQKQSLREVA